jgi:hypothetical protein
MRAIGALVAAPLAAKIRVQPDEGASKLPAPAKMDFGILRKMPSH